ncbi:hypothetical protein GGTG_05589 [Gaeumannomyces tritici R3-111a-1]|uniref:37S ribosomal protein MRP4 n=1 Tax=Gaeumannomyces tritici (strain R3-111a-1) TaxID=644352 RepID=J3NWC5_GAET3|nr:hypothetical protein GGTG_05589 [Gaeumannomyces tritici R3-111a-1]EJT75657.1 hypothetical protein GGTG_05589 [Gaeumannomyces tritici R3-111a-1]
MIVRNVAIRHGRAAVAAASRQCLCGLSTSSTSFPPSAPPPPPLNNAAPTPKPSTAPAAVPRVRDPKLQARFGKAKSKREPDRTAFDYDATQRWKRKMENVGSLVTRKYVPGDLLKDPPRPKDVTLELLMASQCHMGHHKSLWNPANARYIYGVRQDIHVISLEQTAAHLRRAARVVEEVAYHGGLILFAGTRAGHLDIVVRAAELGGGCHLFTKWVPGAITNRDVILEGAGIKIVNELDKPLDGFEEHLRDRRPLAPDLVVCMNPHDNYTLLHECVTAQIPTIGVIDTDADPTKVTYPIPANDDSLRSIAVICGVLGRAAEQGQKRRLEAAATGIVAWENPTDVAKFLRKEAAAAEDAAKEEVASDQQVEAELLAAEEIKRLIL